MALFVFAVMSILTGQSLSSTMPPRLNDTYMYEYAYMMPLDFSFDVVSGNISNMKHLFKSLLDGYDTRIRPIQDQSQAVSVSTQFVPMSLLDLDTMGQKFSILGYFRVSWRDEILMWREETYANTNNVKIPTKEIWTPSLIILKAVNGDGIVGSRQTDIAKVSSTGEVQWVPEGIYSVICDVSIKYYPFDKQVCTITYYVSDETVTSVYLTHDNDVTLDEYTENAGWKITKVVKKQYLKYNTKFIDIEFHVQRRAGFTAFTLILPLLMLAFLNICIFLVPIGSGEKGSFAITIFLSYGIFITIISNTLPQNSLQISYFVVFITILLFLSVFSVFYTVLQAKLVASFGKQRCKWKFLVPKTAALDVEFTEYNKVPGTKQNSSPEKGQVSRVVRQYTWADVLQRIDTMVFVLILAVIFTCTVAFFVIMLQSS